ncbi:hypothetical protein PENTCL1PPCAC_9509, partial [Pristionchus entomophagus]
PDRHRIEGVFRLNRCVSSRTIRVPPPPEVDHHSLIEHSEDELVEPATEFPAEVYTKIESDWGSFSVG